MFKKGQKGTCKRCGKSIKVQTKKHQWCKVCAVLERRERNKTYSRLVDAETNKPRKAKKCWICGGRVDYEEEYVLRRKPICSFCQTYTISWNDKSFKKYWTPTRIKKEKERLKEMCDDSIKRWINPVYQSIGGVE